MVGLVISDSFLLCGIWKSSDDQPQLESITQVPFTQSILSILNDETELNEVLAFALKKVTESHPFDGQSVLVGLPDQFVSHTVMEAEKDLARDDQMEYVHWLNKQKGRVSDNDSIFGQVYLPDEPNIHFCRVSHALIQTVKLSISELGGIATWMGPISSIYLDGSGMSEAAMIERSGNKYSFYKVQNNRFDMGKVAFSGGVPKVLSTTDKNDEITLAALGLIESDLDDIPVFCPQKFGRQATAAWEIADFRLGDPFDDIGIDNLDVSKIPYYEANILTQLILNINTNHSFNFFNEQGITDFFFTEVIPSEIVEDEELFDEELEIENDDEADAQNQPSFLGIAFALLLIVSGFIGINYIKLQDDLNNSVFGDKEEYSIQRSSVSNQDSLNVYPGKVHQRLLKQSKAISTVLLNLLTQTDLDRYSALTITKTFVSLEYTSGENPNIENILGIDPTSFSVSAEGEDSTVFLWYYSFDLPEADYKASDISLSKNDLMVQLDTSIVDYSLKYFEQVYTENEIYGPLLIWVRNKADILQTSAIISNVGDDILLRKFVLFNSTNRLKPRAGFYVSILED